MGRGSRIDRLPHACAVALRLHEAGTSDEIIAAALDCEAGDVAAILAVARHKLAEIELGESHCGEAIRAPEAPFEKG
jgi:hypothetical protein